MKLFNQNKDPLTRDILFLRQKNKCWRTNTVAWLTAFATKMEVMKNYTCPVHADEFSSKPGYCSACAMALTKVKG